MAKYEYKAMDSKGNSTEGVIEADSTIDAINRIREKGLYPTSVTEFKKEDRRKSAGSMKIFSRKKVSQKDMVAFMRQFATLVDAGLPILRSIRVLQEQQPNAYFSYVLAEVANSIEGGSSLSEALKRFPNVFSPLFVNMVKAGEAGGVLDQVLLRMAQYYEKADKLKRKVKASLAYPAFVVLIAGVIMYFLISVVIPKFKMMFEDMSIELPVPTQILINVSTKIKDNLLIIFGVIVVLFVSIKMIVSTEKGKYYVDKILLKLPLIGSLVIKVAIARFARTLGTLLNSGVPILESLNITSQTVGNKIVENNIKMISSNIKEGESMVTPLKHGGLFPPIVLSMISVGEETGKLSEMLTKIADNYDDEVDVAISTITGMIEPFIIVFLAISVGGVVISMFLPIIKIITEMSGQ